MSDEIERLKEKIAKHKANQLEAEKQLQDIMVASGIEDATSRQRRAEILDDEKLGPKGLIDRILKLPLRKREQVSQNVDNLQFVIDRERKAADAGFFELKKLEGIAENERIDGMTKDVFEKFREWTALYQECEDHFYHGLVEAIAAAYVADPNFHLRAERLGLSRTIMVSLDSHFNRESTNNLNMFDIIERITDLGEAYGEHFFRKNWLRQMDVPLFRDTPTL